MRRITYRKAALNALDRMPGKQRSLIEAKVSLYASDPAALANNVLKLSGREGFRMRVGDWRVIFDASETSIDVLAIGPRGSIYD